MVFSGRELHMKLPGSDTRDQLALHGTNSAPWRRTRHHIPLRVNGRGWDELPYLAKRICTMLRIALQHTSMWSPVLDRVPPWDGLIRVLSRAKVLSSCHQHLVLLPSLATHGVFNMCRAMGTLHTMQRRPRDQLALSSPAPHPFAG